MIATLELNEEIIKKALAAYIKNSTGKVTIKSSPGYDYRGNTSSPIISATVDVDVGDILAN